jgi:hypothetical protein
MSRCKSSTCLVMTCENVLGLSFMQNMCPASILYFDDVACDIHANHASNNRSTCSCCRINIIPCHLHACHRCLNHSQNGSIGPGFRPKYCRFSRLLCRWCASSMLIFPSATLQCQQAPISRCINHREGFRMHPSNQCYTATTSCHPKARAKRCYRDSGLTSLGTSSPSRST